MVETTRTGRCTRRCPRSADLRRVDPHLPRTTFVREEDHVVVALIDVPKHAKDDLDGLADLGRVALRRLSYAASTSRLQSAMKARVPVDFSMQFFELTLKLS